MVLRAGWGLVLLAMLAACGQGPSVGDSGADSMAGDSGAAVGDGSIAAPRPVAPPEIPWLDAGVPPLASPLASPPASPVFTPCPAGWQEVEAEGGSVRCDPYGGGRAECPDGSGHFLGEAGCTPVGAACPVGDFPEGLPTDVEVLYVLASAAPGGDGSEGSPLMTLTEALAVASPTTVIAIGKGTYDEAVDIGPGVTLWGACARDTRLTFSGAGSFELGVITVRHANVRLSNLRVGPAERRGVVAAGPSASVSLDGIVIEGVRDIGLYARGGAQVNGVGVSISRTRADPDGWWGRGVQVETGGVVNLTRALLSQNRDIGVLARNAGTAVTLSEVAIEGTQAQARDGTAGWGLLVRDGATAVLTRSLISRNRDIAVFATGAGALVMLSDAIIEDTQARESDGTDGWGLLVQDGARVALTRALISRNRDMAVFASGAGTAVALSDVVIEDTQGQESDGTDGRGLSVENGATAELTRALLSRNRNVSVFASGLGVSLTGSDVVIEDTQAQESDGTDGRALEVLNGATVVFSRALLARNRGVGVFANGEDASVTLSDVVVEDTEAQASDGAQGWGLRVQDGARIALTGARITGNRDVGVFATGAGAVVTLSDVTIEDTQARESDGTGGRGLGVQSGATVELTRALLSRNREVGVFASGPGTAVTLSDVVVEDTQAQDSDDRNGRGLAVQDGATATATRTLFSHNRDLGVFATDGGTSVTLSDVVVEDTHPEESDGTGGRGLNVQLGARATVTRVRLSRNHELGVFVNNAGTSVTLSDVVVEDTQPEESDGAIGRGINVQDGARATITRARFARNYEVGLFVSHPGTSVTLSDVVVEDTQGQESDGTMGGGLHVQEGAMVEVSRARIARNRKFGVLALGTETSVRLSDIVVAQTAEQACGRTTCRDAPNGVGLAGLSEASLVATRFEVLDAALCGVMVADAGEVDLSMGQVSGSTIGVCLQVDGYAISRLTRGVRYLDNGTNLEATSLPVPEPASASEVAE